MDRKLLFQVLQLASLCHVLLATAHHTQEQHPPVPVTIQNYNIQGPVQLTHGNVAGKSDYKPVSQPHHVYRSPVAHPYADAHHELREPAYVITAYKAELRHPRPLGTAQKAQRPYYLPPYYHQAPVFNAPVYQQHVNYPHVPLYHHVPVYIQQEPDEAHYSTENGTAVEEAVEQNVDEKPQMMAVIFNKEHLDNKQDMTEQQADVTSHLEDEQQQVQQVEFNQGETEPVEKAVEAESYQQESARDDEKVEPEKPAEEAQEAYKSETEAPVNDETLEIASETTVVVPEATTEAIRETIETTLSPQYETEPVTELQESPETEATLIVEEPTIGEQLSVMEPATENVPITEIVAVDIATEAATETYTFIQEETTTEAVLEKEAASLQEELETVKVIDLPTAEYLPPVESQTLEEQIVKLAGGKEQQAESEEKPIVPLIYRPKAEQKESNPVPSLVPLIYRAPEKTEEPVLVPIIYRDQVEQRAALEANNVAKRSDSAASPDSQFKEAEPSEVYSTTQAIEIVQSTHASTEAIKLVDESTTAAYEEKSEEKFESTTLKNTFRPSANRRKYKTTTTTTTTTTPLPPVRTKPNYGRNRKPWRAPEVAETTTEQAESVESDDRDVYESEESEKKARRPRPKLNAKRPYPIVTKRPLAASEARESYQSSRRLNNPVHRSSRTGLHFPRRIETRLAAREPTPADYARETQRNESDEESYESTSAESGQREQFVASGSINKARKVSQLMAEEDALTTCTLRKIKEALLSGNEEHLPDGAVYDRENNRVILPEGLVLHYLDESDEFHDA